MCVVISIGFNETFFSLASSHLFVAMIATQKMKEEGKSSGKNLSKIKYLRGKLLSSTINFSKPLSPFLENLKSSFLFFSEAF